MRALVARSVRPRLCHHGSISAQIVPSASRRVIVPPGRRKMTFNDVFTILLGPVLAMAFMADSSWKDKQRDLWDQKLQEVHQEIDVIRQKELQAWSSMQIRSACTGAVQQLRSYSTSAQSCRALMSNDEILASLDAQYPDSEELHLDSQEVEPELSPEAVTEWQQWEKLIASKLALEMILYVRTGKSVVLRQFSPLSTDPDMFSDDLNDLTLKLHQLQGRVSKLIRRRISDSVPASILRTHDRMQLHLHLEELARSCRQGSISVPEMVYGYADAIAKSTTSPYELTYSLMLRSFSARGDETLTFSVMGAMKLCKQRLSNRSIFYMLWQHGQFQDSGRFEAFLELLTRPNSMVKPWTPWRRITIDNVEIAVPSEFNPNLINLLIRVALQCSILHKAEAWAAYLFQHAQASVDFSHCFRSILHHCAANREWKTGHAWIQKTIEWAAVIAKETPHALARTIFRVLDLCVACDKRTEYHRILDAAVSAKLCVAPIDQKQPGRFSDRARSIRNDWLRMLEKSDQKKTLDDVSAVESATRFQTILAADDSEIDRYVGLTDAAQVVQVRQDTDAYVFFPFSNTHQHRQKLRSQRTDTENCDEMDPREEGRMQHDSSTRQPQQQTYNLAAEAKSMTADPHATRKERMDGRHSYAALNSQEAAPSDGKEAQSSGNAPSQQVIEVPASLAESLNEAQTTSQADVVALKRAMTELQRKYAENTALMAQQSVTIDQMSSSLAQALQREQEMKRGRGVGTETSSQESTSDNLIPTPASVSRTAPEAIRKPVPYKSRTSKTSLWSGHESWSTERPMQRHPLVNLPPHPTAEG